jgi:hypothetical protein
VFADVRDAVSVLYVDVFGLPERREAVVATVIVVEIASDDAEVRGRLVECRADGRREWLDVERRTIEAACVPGRGCVRDMDVLDLVRCGAQ